MRKRKLIPKLLRQQVWSKYDGHCAYCGVELAYKDMQVDHIKSVMLGGENSVENLMPACRMCNYYKGAGGIEFLRKELKQVPRRLEKTFLVRLALKYKILDFNKWDEKFFFENFEGGRKT